MWGFHFGHQYYTLIAIDLIAPLKGYFVFHFSKFSFKPRQSNNDVERERERGRWVSSCMILCCLCCPFVPPRLWAVGGWLTTVDDGECANRSVFRCMVLIYFMISLLGFYDDQLSSFRSYIHWSYTFLPCYTHGVREVYVVRHRLKNGIMSRTLRVKSYEYLRQRCKVVKVI